MPNREIIRAQVELLVRCLPALASCDDFALKGGTAINLFHRDMPRLSVDIDLTFLPVTEREAALAAIRAGLEEIGERISRAVPGVDIQHTGAASPKLLVSLGASRIKVEPNTVLRGSLLPPQERTLCQTAQDEFELFARVRCLATEELYAGKLCAALDRQHPRDLFDVKLLQDEGEISSGIRHAFVACVAATSRPMAEILAPSAAPLEDIYESQFVGMPVVPVSLDELLEAREMLFEWARNSLSSKEREFLVSVKRGEPDWSLMDLENLSEWPAVRWKVLNVQRMKRSARDSALVRLRKVLAL